MNEPSEEPRASAPAPRAYLVVHLVSQILTALFTCSVARDPDLGFHLATGRAILERHGIPGTNVLSFAEPGASSQQSEWLSAVVFELAYRALGIAGPILLKMLLVGLTIVFVVETARALGARPSAALLAVSLAVYVAAFRFVERPLLFSNLLIVAIGLARVRLERAPSRALRVGLVLALALTAHLHGGVIFAAFYLVALAVIDGLSSRPSLGARLAVDPATTRRLTRVELRILALGLGLSALSLALVHPHPVAVWTVPFELAGDPFLHRNLVEFRRPVDFPLVSFAGFWILALAAFVAAIGSRGRRPAVVLLPIAFGLALALRHVRFVDLFAYLAAPPIALALGRVMARPGRPVHGEAAVVALALTVGSLSLIAVVESDSAGFGYDPRVFPRALMRDARRLGLRGPAFVQDGWAGPYLAFRFPAERVFFHPAFDAYSTRFFREDYVATRDGAPGWDAVLDRHGVRLVLLKWTSPGESRRQRGAPNLRQRLVADPRWALVGFDDEGLVVARRSTLGTAGREAVIEGLDPDEGRFLGDPARALPGLEALRDRGMETVRSRVLLAAARHEAATWR